MLKIYKYAWLEYGKGTIQWRYIAKYKGSLLPIYISNFDDKDAVDTILDQIVKLDMLSKPLDKDNNVNEHYKLIYSLNEKEVKELIVQSKLWQAKLDFV